MSIIKISDLRPAGYDLFSDNESFIDNLSEEEIAANKGGSSAGCVSITTVSVYFIGRKRGWW